MKVLLHLGGHIIEHKIKETVPPPELTVDMTVARFPILAGVLGALPDERLFCFCHRADGMPLYKPQRKQP